MSSIDNSRLKAHCYGGKHIRMKYLQTNAKHYVSKRLEDTGCSDYNDKRNNMIPAHFISHTYSFSICLLSLNGVVYMLQQYILCIYTTYYVFTQDQIEYLTILAACWKVHYLDVYTQPGCQQVSCNLPEDPF